MGIGYKEILVWIVQTIVNIVLREFVSIVFWVMDCIQMDIVNLVMIQTVNIVQKTI